MRFLPILLFACLSFIGIFGSSGEAKAWGKFGHLTVCDLAYRNLTPASRIALNDLLQSRTGGINVPGQGRLPDRHYTSFNVGCLEEDALPRRHPEDHFLNLDRGLSAISGASCPAATPDCILSGLQRDLDTLRDPQRSRADRVFALMAIGHWVGDIHQPLHVSFADDRGGNGIDIRLTGRCGGESPRPDNLHGVWDNCLLEAGLFEKVRRRADFRSSWSRNTITYRAVDTLLANTSLADERALVSGDPWQWAADSYLITRAPETRYCTVQDGVCRYSPDAAVLTRNGTKREQLVDATYLARFAPVAEEQVRRAGFRLAHLLNLALDPAYREPMRDGTQPG
ncbi:MAG: S1/P1 nuclease [Sphingomonas sp.]|uniref:S1/P1 nuclease n=1 Tax=Sphingomonas sp. TaxID=28214 RepID=UPI0025CC88A9|nr:S1/P1 nuclease [Sphingomonas sp.]MBQ1500383.1 S1/P1 nuclease [Sphingomonas sp.]